MELKLWIARDKAVIPEDMQHYIERHPEDEKCIGSHYCSSRGFANHDLTEWRLKELQVNNISKVYSNGKLVWENQEMTKDAKDEFYKANVDYEQKYCH